MPATYAHYTFASEVLDRLSENNRKIIEENRQLYDIGLHGPDILFYYKPYQKNKINQTGNDMHKESGYKFFHKNKDLIEKSPKHKSYLYGFICHFALDQACHGYVGEVEKEGYQHTKIESEFERFLMIKDNIDLPQEKVLTNHIIASSENSSVIKDFYEDISSEDIRKSLKQMNFYHEVLRSPGKLKRGILNLAFNLLNFESFKGLLIAHEHNEEFDKFNQELFDRYKIGIDNAVTLIEEFEDSKDGKISFNKLYNYDFGSNWRGE